MTANTFATEDYVDDEVAGVTGAVESVNGDTGAVVLTAADVGAQPVDSDLTTIAGLTATTDSFIQSKSSAWAARTIAQVKTDLGIPQSRIVQILVSDPTTPALTTGNGKAYFRVNAALTTWKLTAVAAAVTTASTSGLPTVQITNVTQAAVAMLSTALTIDANETDSSTAATAAVVNGATNTVTTADLLRVDVTTAGTGTLGLIVELTFTPT